MPKENASRQDTIASSRPPDTAENGRSERPARHIDVETAYQIARQSARVDAGFRNPRAAQPRLDEAGNTPLGIAVATSSRPDCRSAYAGAGLFAIPFLLKDAIGDKGCKW